MAEETDSPRRRHFGLRDVPGTTVALTSLAVLGAAAIVSTPVWLWYRSKRKRTDALARQSAPVAAPPADDAPREPTSR